MENNIQVPLNLPDTRVLEVTTIERGHWLIRVESTLPTTICKRCGRLITDFHGLDQAVRLRHLPLFEVPVFIELRPKRFRCRFCEGNPTTTQKLDWYEPRSPNTKAYEEWLLRLLINSTIADTARKLWLTQELVEGVLDRWLAKQVDWHDYERLSLIGLDEIALKRGHRDFVTLVTTVVEGGGVAVLAVLADRKKETVAAFFAAMPEDLRQSIERVCTDMYQGYVEAAREQVGWAKIVVDRFHVARAYRGCAEQVRKKEVKRLKKELCKADYERIKGAMWPFRKRPAELDDEEWNLLERLFTQSPKLERAYNLREDLTELFEREYSKSGAKRAIRAWCKKVRKSGLEEYKSFLRTIEKWLDEITNYFLEGQTSGFVEGFNNRVKVLKRRCYGIFDVGRIFQRLTLDVSGYDLFGQV